MDDMIYLFAAVVFLAAVLASISIWAPRKLWIRDASVIATAGLIIISNIGFSALLSRPKPIHLEWAMQRLPRHACSAHRRAKARRFSSGCRFAGSPNRALTECPGAASLRSSSRTRRNRTVAPKQVCACAHHLEINNQKPAFYSPLRRSLALKDARESEPMIFEESR